MKRKKLWFIGLAMLTGTILIFNGHDPSTSTLNFPAQAQNMPQIIAGRSGVTSSGFLIPPPPPKATVTATSKPTVEPTAAPKPGPSPSPTKDAETTAAPNSTPTSSPKPTPEAKPEAKPAPVAPATTPNTSTDRISAATLPLSESPYNDPQGRFEVGILQNYKVSSIADAPLIESPDGNMAYTVVVQEKIRNVQFTPDAIAQMATDQFQGGEGFQTDSFQVLGPGEILIPWTGTVTIGRKTQAISGSILVRQNSDQIAMLLLSATDAASENISSAISTLSDSLKFL